MTKDEKENIPLWKFLVVDVVIMIVFYTFNFLTNFGNKNIELTTIYYIAFAVVLIIVNFILIQYFKKYRK